MPIAFRRLSRRLLSTAKGRAGLVTRQVSSRNTLPFCRGIPYRKDGTSSSAPHTPSPAAGCSKSLNLQQQRRRYGKNTDPFAGGTFCTRRRALSVQTPKPHPQLLSTQSSSSCHNNDSVTDAMLASYSAITMTMALTQAVRLLCSHSPST